MSADKMPPLPEPVAWGLFAKVEDGSWHLQHPVRFTEADAKADRSMYERTTLLDIRPLHTDAYARAYAAEQTRELVGALERIASRLQMNVDDEPRIPAWVAVDMISIARALIAKHKEQP